MKWLEDFKESFPPGTRKKLTKEEKLAILGIDEERQAAIEQLEFRRIAENEDEFKNRGIRTVHLVDVVGINRDDRVGNWLELLLALHKQNNFKLFKDRDSHARLLLDRFRQEDLPRLIEVEGRYYVAGNGKHRLTFAKCLGIAEALAWISSRD